MAVQTVPFALQNASHSAALFRQAMSGMYTVGGVLATNELLVTQSGTPAMLIVLGPGRAKIPGTLVSPPSGMGFTTQGMYDSLNDAALTITVSTSNATNPRIDAAYIQIQDSFYSGAANQAIAGIAAGVPSVSPSAPAIPTNAILIAYIAVGANVTSIVTANITQQTTLANVLGAPRLFTSKSNMDANPLFAGALAMVTASGINTYNGAYYFDGGGSAFLPIGLKLRATAGKTSGYPQNFPPIVYFERVSATSGASGLLPAVTFPTAFPNGILGVICFPLNGSAAAMALNSDTQSTSGFQPFINAPSTAITYQYLAIGW
jgi:hypothetical protein